MAALPLAMVIWAIMTSPVITPAGRLILRRLTLDELVATAKLRKAIEVEAGGVGAMVAVGVGATVWVGVGAAVAVGSGEARGFL